MTGIPGRRGSVVCCMLMWQSVVACFELLSGCSFRVTTEARQFLGKVMPWLRWLGAGSSPRNPGFNRRAVDVVFVVDGVASVQLFHAVLQFPLSVSSCLCSTLVSY
jgi:hypothetical protein